MQTLWGRALTEARWPFSQNQPSSYMIHSHSWLYAHVYVHVHVLHGSQPRARNLNSSASDIMIHIDVVVANDLIGEDLCPPCLLAKLGNGSSVGV